MNPTKILIGVFVFFVLCMVTAFTILWTAENKEGRNARPEIDIVTSEQN